MADIGWVSLVWPIPLCKVITQGFGERPDYYAQFQWKIGHSGLDIRTRTDGYPSGIGTPIVAARGGTVRHAGEHFYPDGRATGYGIAIELRHTDGSRTLYAHLSKVRVQKGESVLAGQHIGDGGQTGNADGPHLHFELWVPPFTEQGVWGRRDPTAYIEEVTFGGVGIRSLEPEEPIHQERSLDDATCTCPPFIPEP
ncbi:MAG: M23 family metallopeptidase [Ardenticatenales bacterium]|nr:M23 family metallopeptidase [Ardenticatenales bacterium]